MSAQFVYVILGAVGVVGTLLGLLWLSDYQMQKEEAENR